MSEAVPEAPSPADRVTRAIEGYEGSEAGYLTTESILRAYLWDQNSEISSHRTRRNA